MNPFKNKNLLSFESRIKCLKILTKNMQNVLVSEYEILNKIVFSIDSIRYFKSKYKPKNIFLAIGADNFINLHKWHEYSELIKLVKLIVIHRDNIKLEGNIYTLNLKLDYSSSDIKKNILNNKNKLESKIPLEIIDIINAEVNLKKRLDFIVELLESKKASDVVVFDLSKYSYITQYVIIATSLIDKHGLSLLDTLKSELKQRGEVFYAVDDEVANWIIADLGDIIIHLFTQEHRARFNLEEFLNEYIKEKEMKEDSNS